MSDTEFEKAATDKFHELNSRTQTNRREDALSLARWAREFTRKEMQAQVSHARNMERVAIGHRVSDAIIKRHEGRDEILQSAELKGLLTVANKWADYDDGEMREAIDAFRAKFGKGEG